jgi:tRNA (guanine37-N1)-methyltransferase
MDLRTQVKGRVPEYLIKHVPKRFDIMGDIAVISIPHELDSYKFDIARSITELHRNLKTVLNKTTKINGDKRTANFEIIFGNETITTYKEHGFSYRLDVGKAFFNNRLSYERQRLIAKINPYEKILIPFCGVGPFAIPAAFHGFEAVAIEKNPEAFKWLQENICLNKVKDSITLIQKDVTDISTFLNSYDFDRVIVPTPYGMDNILLYIAKFVKSKGFIHFYTFKPESEISEFIDSAKTLGLETIYYRRCGNVAPGISRWGIDFKKME